MLDIHYMSAMVDAYTSVNRPLMYWRAIGVERAQQGFSRVAESIRQDDLHSTSLLDAIVTVGNFLTSAGMPKIACTLLRLAVDIQRRQGGQTETFGLTTKMQLGVALRDSGQLTAAEDLLSEALAGLQDMGEPHSRNFIMATNEYAILQQIIGNYAGAAVQFRTLLRTCIHALGEEDEQSLAVANNLANMLHALGDSEEAIRILEGTLEVKRSTIGDAHPDTLVGMNNLGLVLTDLGRTKEAEDLLRQCLSASERAIGRTHPNTVLPTANLARLLLTEERFDEARPLLQEAVTSYQRTLGSDHLFTLTAQINLADMYRQVGQGSRAEALFRQVLDSIEQAHGLTHPTALAVTAHLARCALDRGGLRDVEPILTSVANRGPLEESRELTFFVSVVEECADAWEKQGQLIRSEQLLRQLVSAQIPDSDRVQVTRFNLACVLLRLQRAEEALEILQRVLDHEVRRFGMDAPMTASTHFKLAYALKDLGRLDEAIMHRERCLAIEEKHLGLAELDTLETVLALAEDLAAAKRTAESRSLLTRALAVTAEETADDPGAMRALKRELIQALAELS